MADKVSNETLIQQPQPNDIVGERILVGGLATGFEATISVRVRDGNGVELASTFTMSGGGAGEVGQFQVDLELPVRPSTPNGFVEVFEENAAFPDGGPHGGGASEIHKSVVPIVFGTSLVDTYVGYKHHVVVEGDTLSGIAATVYGDGDRWPAIYEANRDQIGNADLIFHGQELRIPHYMAAATTTVDVFFLNTDNFNTGTEPLVEAVTRQVSAELPASGALQALFAGPSATEQATYQVVKSGAVGFANLSIDGGIARVHLVGGCDSGGSTMTIANLITPTLKQFSTVDHVKIFDPDGNTGQPNGPTDSMPGCLEP